MITANQVTDIIEHLGGEFQDSIIPYNCYLVVFG